MKASTALPPSLRAAAYAVADSIATNVLDTAAGTWASAEEAVDAHRDSAEEHYRDLPARRNRGALPWGAVREFAVDMLVGSGMSRA